jgi:SagB-type dehydrogenase family enzyme
MGEIELYLAIRECRGLERGLYHYDPFGHDLTRLNTTTVGDLERLERLAKDASRATGVEREHEIVMLFTARIGRSLWKYEAIAYSLALRDLGGLTQNIYLVSCALGLRSCAIGMGDATLFAHLSGNDAWTEALIGELALNG